MSAAIISNLRKLTIGNIWHVDKSIIPILPESCRWKEEEEEECINARR